MLKLLWLYLAHSDNLGLSLQVKVNWLATVITLQSVFIVEGNIFTGVTDHRIHSHRCQVSKEMFSENTILPTVNGAFFPLRRKRKKPCFNREDGKAEMTEDYSYRLNDAFTSEV